MKRLTSLEGTGSSGLDVTQRKDLCKGISSNWNIHKSVTQL